MSAPWTFMCGGCGAFWEGAADNIGVCPHCIGGKPHPMTDELIADMCIGHDPTIRELLFRMLRSGNNPRP